MSDVLTATGLVKRYADLRAVDGIDLNIPAGACVGLLGPNGAGKTTTVEMLEGVVTPDAGEILFHGEPRDTTFRERTGVQFQSTALQDFMTSREALQLFHSMYSDTANLDELIELCTLHEFLDQYVRELSGGQRQRLLLAIALVNQPELVFLDEPTTGLDPQARRNFWSLVKLIKGQGKTVVLTTHYMEEAYQLCDRIVIMDHGHIIAEGTPSELLRHHFDHVVLELPEELVSDHIDALPFPVVCADDTAQIFAEDVDQAIAALQQANISLAALRVRPRTLEDLFIELTGKELRA